MRAAWRTAIGVTVSCLWVLALAPPTSAAPAGPVPQCNGAPAPWLDPHKPSDERARLVLAQMTLDEKILELGSITDATHSRETPPIARLCIPALRMNNGSAGVSTGGPTQFPATALPAPIGLAATFDPRQARRYGVVEGVETQAQGRNLLGDLLQEEVRLRERVVAIGDEAVVICPFASRSPYELMLIPRRPRARFQDDGPLGAGVLHEALARLRAALGGMPALNMWVRTAPAGAGEFCWHLDVLPRLAHLAGLEMGTGVSLNIVPPERAASELRDAA